MSSPANRCPFLRVSSRPVVRWTLLALLAAASARALTWETTVRELRLDAGTPEVVVEFPYTNDTRAPVTFTGAKAGCDCTTPALPAQPVPAGGKGVLKASYHPGSAPGEKTVSIEVRTDEPGAPATVLRIKAVVTPVLSLTPVLLRWTLNGPADTRECVIRNLRSPAVGALTLLPPPASVTATLAPGKEPGTWILSVTPVSTGEAMTARVQLQAEADGRPLVHSIYALVR